MKGFLYFTVLVSVLIFLGCKKDQPEPDNDTPVDEVNDPAVVVANSVVVDSTTQDLVSTEQQLLDGIYVFDVSGGTVAEEGDIIIGIQNGGFLRKVTSVSQSGGQVTYTTDFAAMDEVFESGTVSLDINMNDSYQYKSNITHSFSGEELYNNNGVVITADGSLSLNIPNMDADISFETFGLGVESATFNMPGATISGDLTFNLNASGTLPLFSDEVEVAGFKRPFYGMLGPLPVAGIITTDIVVKCNAQIDASGSSSLTFENTSPFSFGCTYANGTWDANLAFTPNTTMTFVPPSGGAAFNYNAELVPRISIEFYNVVGPYGEVALKSDVVAAAELPAGNWHLSSEVYFHSVIGVQANIFDTELANYNTTWTSPKLIKKTPSAIEMVSGNNQSGPAETNLVDPISVRVLDSDGDPQSNVPVFFEIIAGGGSLSVTEVLTNGSGVAQTLWELGANGSGAQQISATAKDGAGTTLNGGPIFFVATIDVSTPFSINAQAVAPDSMSTPTTYEGEITVNGSGGTPPYEYKLGAGGTYSSDSIFSNLQGGAYDVYGRDADNTELFQTVYVDTL